MTGSPENYKGQYASLKFDPYKHREFPKAVYVDGKLIGTASNLLEEKELYTSRGIERGDIDPMTSLRDENAELKAKLAQFESGQPAVGRSAGARTNTVEMLSASVPDPDGKPAAVETPAHVKPTGNPLLKPAAQTGTPGAQGTAPKVDKQISPGV